MDIGIERVESKTKIKISGLLKIIFWLIIVFCLLIVFIILHVQFKYSDNITNGEDLTPPNVGLIFGAGLRAKGEPGIVLEDRILTAIQLYQNGKVDRFILSGDNSSIGHNEVQAMKNLFLERGVPEDILLLDHAGLSTLDSCRQVKDEFGLNKIVLITQKYHLRRALYVCNKLGLEAIGVPAQNSGYAKQWKFTIREWGASVQAFIN